MKDIDTMKSIEMKEYCRELVKENEQLKKYKSITEGYFNLIIICANSIDFTNGIVVQGCDEGQYKGNIMLKQLENDYLKLLKENK